MVWLASKEDDEDELEEVDELLVSELADPEELVSDVSPHPARTASEKSEQMAAICFLFMCF